MDLDLSGVNPANLVPFADDGTIHEDGLKQHIQHLVRRDCVNGIICNGHAGEAHAMTSEERARVTRIVIDAADEDTPIVSGVMGGPLEQILKDAQLMEEIGADGILLFPPYAPINRRPQAVMHYFQDISDAIDIPIVLFQMKKATGDNYPTEVLKNLARIENVVAMKNAVWDISQYHKDERAIRESDTDVQVLSGNDEHLLASYAIGADGTILELAAAIPEEIAEMFHAVNEGNIERARDVHRQLSPFLDAVYQSPGIDGALRLKVALELQDKLPTATPRRPAVPIPEEEIQNIEHAMKESKLL